MIWLVREADGHILLTTPDKSLAEMVVREIKGTQLDRAHYADTAAQIACRDVYVVVLGEQGETVDRRSEWKRPWDVNLGGRSSRGGGGLQFTGRAITGWEEAEKLARRELDASKKGTT